LPTSVDSAAIRSRVIGVVVHDCFALRVDHPSKARSTSTSLRITIPRMYRDRAVNVMDQFPSVIIDNFIAPMHVAVKPTERECGRCYGYNGSNVESFRWFNGRYVITAAQRGLFTQVMSVRAVGIRCAISVNADI
jgi:hypothetical protein